MSQRKNIEHLRAAARLASEARLITGAKKDGGGSQRAPVEAADSLRSTQVAQVLDLLSEGEIGGLVNGERSIYLDGVPLKGSDGTYNFKDVVVAWNYGTQGQAALPDLSGVQNEVAVSTAVTAATPVVRTITNLAVDTLRVTISVPQISSTDASTGDINGSSFTWAVEVQASGGGYVEVFQDTVTGKKMSAYKRSKKFKLTGTGPWNVRVKRITADSGSVSVVNAFLWDSYTEIQSLKLRYPNSALVLLSVNAQQFARIPTRAYDILGLKVRVPSNYDPLTRVYTGVWNGTWKMAWTDNPAWIFLELVSNERWGLGEWLGLAGFNPETAKWQLYTISQYCDVMVSDGYGSTEPRFTCNAYIQTREQAMRVVQDFAAIFRGAAFWAGGELHVMQDAPSDPVAVFSPANVVGGRFSYQTGSDKQRHSVFIVYWNNLAEFGRRTPEVWAPDHLVARYGVKEIEVEPIGITRRGQALRLAKWMAYTEEFEGRVVAFKLGGQGAIALPGQVFQIADPSEAGERLGGRIQAATPSQVTLDAQVMLQAGEVYTLTVQLADPANPAALITQQRAVTNAPGSTQVITLAAPFSQAPAPQAVWILQSTAIAATTWRCLSCRESDDGTEYEITALAHDPAKYAAVEDGLVLESTPVTRLVTQCKPPTSVTLTPQTYQDGQTWRIKLSVSWVPSAAGLQHIVSWRMAQGSWTTLGATVDQAVDVAGLDAGAVQVEVRAVNSLGTVSVPATASVALTGNTVPAANVTGLAYSIDALGALVTWNPSSDFDWSETEVRMGTTWASATTLAGGRVTNYRLGWPPNGTYFILVRHRRRSGPDGVVAAVNVTVTDKQLLANALDNLIGPAQLRPASVDASKLAAQAVTLTSFANGLEPIGLVTAVPAVKSTGTVFNSTDGKLYRWNGSTYVATVPASDLSGQIGPSQLAADSVIAGKVAAGAINARELAVGAVTTDKLLVTGRGKALNDDPACGDISAWTAEPMGSIAVVTGAGAPIGSSALRATNGTRFYSRTFPVEAGKSYKVSLWARQVSGGGVIYVRLNCYNTAGTLISSVVTGITPTTSVLEGLTVPGTWTRFSGSIVPAAGSVVAQVLLLVNWPTTGVTDVTDVRCEEYIGADLIVDGTITASKIDSRGLSIKDASGNVILAAGTPLAASNITPATGWLNSQVTLNASGQLLNGGSPQGQVTLPGMGLRSFRVEAAGNGGSAPGWAGGGIRDLDNGLALVGAGVTRSYSVVELRASDLAVLFAQTYDVFANGEVTAGRNAATMANDLNFLCDNRPGNFIVVFTFDEPRNNRLNSGLDAAMYRCGASRAVFGSANFAFRAAYILVGRAGIGEGNGVEQLSAVGDGPGAWAQLTFAWRNGSLTVSGQGTTPRTLSDYGYSGDLDAQRNGRITIDGSGTIQGIGSGAGSAVANSQIGINASGQIYGVGAGSGITVSNGQMSIDSAGRLYNAGTQQGQVTLPGMGLRSFRVEATGAGGISPGGAGGGIRDLDNGLALVGAAPIRSYTVVEFRASDLAVLFSQTYDVIGGGALTAGRNAAVMANDLNSICDNRPGNFIVVFTEDEPATNRGSSGLDLAMYRCGASRAVFGSANFQYRAAYILVGRAGIGEGNGVEQLSAVGNAPGAWAQLTFSWRNGSLTVSGQGTTPRTLSDYGYSGDLDATRGAPAGTLVAGDPAQNVVRPGNAITSANVSTYIAAAAIQNAQIANLDAAKINTGTLDAGRIGVGSLNADRITAGTINTDRLVVGAATAAATQSYNSGSNIFGSPGSATTSISTPNMAFTSTGAAVMVWATAEVNLTPANTATQRIYVTAELRADGSIIDTHPGQFLPVFAISGGVAGVVKLAFVARHVPSAGAHNYNLTLAWTLRNSSNADVTPNGGSYSYLVKIYAQENKV